MIQTEKTTLQNNVQGTLDILSEAKKEFQTLVWYPADIMSLKGKVLVNLASLLNKDKENPP